MSVLNKLKSQFGFDDENYEEYDNEVIYDRDKENKKEFVEEVKINKENVIRPGAFNKVHENSQVTMQQKRQEISSNQVVNVVKPQKFDEALKVAQDILKGNIVVLNTSLMETRVAQRFLDFISGASFAIGGEVTLVDDNIYIVSPKDIEINDTISRGTSLKNLFNL